MLMKNKFLAVVLSFCIVTSLMPASVIAASVEQNNEGASEATNISDVSVTPTDGVGEALDIKEENSTEQESEDIKHIEDTETKGATKTKTETVNTEFADANKAEATSNVDTTIIPQNTTVALKSSETENLKSNKEIEVLTTANTLSESVTQTTPEVQSTSTIVYIPRNTTSISVSDIVLPKETYSSSARLQLVDEAVNVVATTDGESFDTYENGDKLYLSNQTLYFMLNPISGNYSFQVVDGTADDPVTTNVTTCSGCVVDDPVISRESIYMLIEGTSSINAQITFQNFSGSPDDFVLKLYDSENNVVATSESHTGLYCEDNHNVKINYALGPTQDIIAGKNYTLGVERLDGNVYTSIEPISATACDAEIEKNEISIISVEEDSVNASGIIVNTENTSASKEYELIVKNNDSTIYKDTISPNEEGVFNVSLQKNGLNLPLYAYNNRNFYVTLKDNENSQKDYGSLFVDAGEGYDQWSSFSLSKDSDNKYYFTLTGYNAIDKFLF